MSDLADIFISLPGGWGTLDELAEILTWNQLSLVNRPTGILNCNGYFDPLILQMQKMVDEGFLQNANLAKLVISNNVNQLLTSLQRLTTHKL